MRSRTLLRLEDKLAAEDAHLRALGSGDQRPRLFAAVAAAIAIHAAVVLLPAPRATGGAPPPPERPAFPAVVRWAPAPPEPPAPPGPVRGAPATAPHAGIADGRPAAPPLDDLAGLTGAEPVAEPLPPVEASLPHDAEMLIGTPVPPPALADSGVVEDAPTIAAVVAPGGRVEPDYPPAARALRVSGTVTLQVEVAEDGTVGGVTVVGVSRRGLGFEAAATAAVKRWRFLPGTRAGRPVRTTSTVEVAFR